MSVREDIDAVVTHGDNADSFHDLRLRVQRNSVVPFVGAGLSVPFGYPPWSAVLRNHARDAGVLMEVETHVVGGKFEEAASLVAKKLGPGFNTLLKQAFNARRLEGRPIDGAPRVLPKIFSGPVVTSNYDEVVERAYAQEGQRFTRVVRPTDEELLSEAFSGNCHYLLQIHGYWAEAASRILTLEEYKSYYGGDTAQQFDVTRGLPQALHLMFLSRSVLFLGCSLNEDRYLQVLAKLVADGWRVPPHYALLESPKTDQQRQARRTQLLFRNILPIFFPPGRFDLIEGVLERLRPGVDEDEGDAPSETQPIPSPPLGGRVPPTAPMRSGELAMPSSGTRSPPSAAPIPGERVRGPSHPNAPQKKRTRSGAKPHAIRRSIVPKSDGAEAQGEDPAEEADDEAAETGAWRRDAITRLSQAATKEAAAIQPPPALLESIKNQRCVVFVGGGASLDAGLPHWVELVSDLVRVATKTKAIDEHLAATLQEKIEQGDPHAAIDACRERMPVGEMEAFIMLRLETNGRYSPTHERIAQISFAGALTSNFDSFVERTHPKAKFYLPQEIAELGADGADRVLADPEQFAVMKLRGSSDVPTSLLLARDDYAPWHDNPGYSDFLARVFTNYSVFFYGYSLASASIRAVLRRAFLARGTPGPHHHFFAWNPPEAKLTLLREHYGVESIVDPQGMTNRKALAFLEKLRDGTK